MNSLVVISTGPKYRSSVIARLLTDQHVYLETVQLQSAAGARCHLTTVRRSHCHTYHNSATADICVNKPLLYRSRRECEEEEDVVKVIARNVMTKQPLASQQRHKSVELHSWLLNVNIALILRRLVILIQEVMACK